MASRMWRCFLCWFLWAGWQACAAESGELIITYTDYQPYSWEVAGKAQGLEVDLLNEALGKRMGYTLKHKVLPWERAQQLVRNNDADAFVATINAERANYTDVGSEPLTFWEISLYFRKGDARFEQIKSLQELAAFQIGSLKGNGWAKKNLAGMKVEYVNKMALLPKMLLLGRIDVIPDNPYVMRNLLLNEAGAGKIDEVTPGFLREGMFLMAGKHSPLNPRLKELDGVLQQMKLDGSWQRIHDQYKVRKK